jgi:hypothetical protein
MHSMNFQLELSFLATEVANEFFQHMVPSKLIHDKYQPSIVTNVIKRQLASQNCSQRRKEAIRRKFSN